MRRIGWLAGILVAMALAPAARAQSVENAFREFGLIGTWARDCTRPAFGANIHSVYAVGADGVVTLSYERGPGSAPTRYRILSARVVAPDRIAYREENVAERRQLDIEVQLEQGRIRVWLSRRTTGEVLVRDGKFNDGVGSPWQNRCR
ncbi:MAG: hypothetical protein KIT16_11870 [Rhodospirillaceae bacterium]|nr:hypothetical protein [Rhodospirillaceae bacterium]